MSEPIDLHDIIANEKF